MEYFVGLDLGQVRDHTAVAVVTPDDLYKEALALNAELRRRRHPDRDLVEPHDPIYEVVHLERLPLGTGYPEVVERVRALLSTPPLRGNADLAVDATGVGAAVVDMLGHAGLSFKSVVITGGERQTRDGDTHRVPKRDLIAAPQVLLQGRRLKIAPDLPDAETLTEELLNFRHAVTRSANEAYGAWREGDHDDLVLAVALAVWAAHKTPFPAPNRPAHIARTANVSITPLDLPFPPSRRRPF